MKKNYNRARKNHYNLITVKGNTEAYLNASEKRAEAKAEAQTEAKKAGSLKPKDIVIISSEKPEVITNKSDLMKAEKARLESELNYERKHLNANRNKPYYMSSVSIETAKRYDSIAIKTEAIQRINEETEAEAEAKKAVTMYETCGQWLSEPEAEKQYKPIDSTLWAFARKQKTMQAKHILTYTENGFRKNSLEYEDYKQTCYLTLFEYAIENPSAEFGKALFICMKNGIYAEWRKMHNPTKDEDGKTIERIIDSLEKPFDSSEPESGSLKDALPDTFAKPLDYDLIQNEECERIYDLCKGSEAVYLSDLADGYNVKEIAYFNGTNYDTIQKQIYRAKKRIAKDLRKESELNEVANEVARQMKNVVLRKAYEPSEPDFYHNMSCVVPFMEDVKPYDIPNTCEAFERMINKPLMYAKVMDSNKRSKRTYVKAKDGSEAKRIKPEAEVSYIAKAKPEAMPKYSEYDNDGLKARIHKADIKKAECEAWEAVNTSYCKKLYAGIGK